MTFWLTQNMRQSVKFHSTLSFACHFNVIQRPTEHAMLVWQNVINHYRLHQVAHEKIPNLPKRTELACLQ